MSKSPALKFEGAISVWSGLLVLAILAVIALFLIPVYTHPGGASMANICLSQVKQQATGILIYRADHNERIPLRDNWMDALIPYVKMDAIFHCPAVQEANDKNPHLYGYSLNSGLSGVDAEKIANPERVALLYDSSNLARNASDPLLSLPDPPRTHEKRKGNNIGYLDGHVRRLRVNP